MPTACELCYIEEPNIVNREMIGQNLEFLISYNPDKVLSQHFPHLVTEKPTTNMAPQKHIVFDIVGTCVSFGQ